MDYYCSVSHFFGGFHIPHANLAQQEGDVNRIPQDVKHTVTEVWGQAEVIYSEMSSHIETVFSS